MICLCTFSNGIGHIFFALCGCSVQQHHIGLNVHFHDALLFNNIPPVFRDHSFVWFGPLFQKLVMQAFNMMHSPDENWKIIDNF